jgi:hypothetical protein
MDEWLKLMINEQHMRKFILKFKGYAIKCNCIIVHKISCTSNSVIRNIIEVTVAHISNSLFFFTFTVCESNYQANGLKSQLIKF